MPERNRPIGRHDRHLLVSFFKSRWVLLNSGIVTLQGCSLYVNNRSVVEMTTTDDLSSKRSRSSNPFWVRIAILVFKKMVSYALKGRKNSCWIALITKIAVEIGFMRTLYVRNHSGRVKWGPESSGPSPLTLPTVGSST